MAITVFPVSSGGSSSSGPAASSITATTANTMYAASLAVPVGIYTITCASATIAKVEFYSSVNTLITTAVTASGTITINLGTAADRIRLWTNTGSDVVITITLVASALTNNFSGTLDTITASGTYTGTSSSGYGYCVVAGGGAGGAPGPGPGTYGAGGGAGGVSGKLVALSGSMAVTVGQGGAISSNGTASTFDTMTANGGVHAGAGGTASGGTWNNNGQAAPSPQGGSPTNYYTFMGPVPFGTGGTNGSGFGAGQAGQGYSAGGGGGGSAGAGSVGAPGVVLVLRF